MDYQELLDYLDKTPELEPYRDIILYDWTEGEEHWRWVVTAPVSEVIDWAEVVRRGEEEQAAAEEFLS